ncbi:MAG: hypothetical protein AAB377_00330 [Patescibacteria group bacterium]
MKNNKITKIIMKENILLQVGDDGGVLDSMDEFSSSVDSKIHI